MFYIHCILVTSVYKAKYLFVSASVSYCSKYLLPKCQNYLDSYQFCAEILSAMSLLFSGVSSLLPYLNLYMNQIGLTMSEIGIIYGTMPFVSAIMRTVIGGVADKFQKHKLILMICCVVSGLAHLTLYWVPPNPVSMKMSCETDLQHMRFRCCSSSLGNNTSTCVGEDISTINTTHPLVCAPTQNTKNPKDCSVICSKLDLSPSDACAADNISSPADVTALSLQCPSAVFSSSSNQISFSVKELVASSYPMCSCLDYELSGIQLEDVAYRSGSCGEAFTTSCTVDCDVNRPQCELLTVENTTLCAQDTKQVPEVKPPLFGLTFALFFIIYLIGSLAFNPIFSLIDALVYANLRKVGGEWGPQRMWGTVAFAIFAVIAGFMMDIFGTGNNEKNFLFSFVSYAVSQFLAGLLVCFYRISQEVKCANLMKNMGNLLCRVDVLVLLFSIFLFGCYTGLIETCLYVNLFGLGGTGLLVGICMVVNCIPEILILLFAGTIINKLGYFTCMTISYAAYTARVLGYAFIRNPWLVLILEPLHGITFGLMYATVTSHGSLITPPGMHGTIQSLIGALYFGFGKLES